MAKKKSKTAVRKAAATKASPNRKTAKKKRGSGERELIENSWRDDFWGWGPNRDGQNMLGRLWMEIRDELRGQK